jgi:hypothetical protein
MTLDRLNLNPLGLKQKTHHHMMRNARICATSNQQQPNNKFKESLIFRKKLEDHQQNLKKNYTNIGSGDN